MATFTVHMPPNTGEALSADKIVFLRDGFSWPAFLFGPVWLAWNRAFLAAGAWTGLLVLVSLAGIELGIGEGALSLVSVALALALGFEGSRLIARTLTRRGYREAAVVSSDDAGEAEEIFFHNWRPETAPGTSA